MKGINHFSSPVYKFRFSGTEKTDKKYYMLYVILGMGQIINSIFLQSMNLQKFYLNIEYRYMENKIYVKVGEIHRYSF